MSVDIDVDVIILYRISSISTSYLVLQFINVDIDIVIVYTISSISILKLVLDIYITDQIVGRTAIQLTGYLRTVSNSTNMDFFEQLFSS